MPGFSHTGRVEHPRGPHLVALVAYERLDGRWDLFIFEPPGVLPAEWEANRIDKTHVYAGALEESQISAAATRIDESLGPSYAPVRAFREEKPGDDRRCKRAIHLLHKKNCTGYEIRCLPGHIHEFWVRQKDLPVIKKLI